MRRFNEHSMLLLFLVFIIGAIITSCKKEPEEGTPSIDYIRSTNPELADSTFTSAFMGQLIAIVGENLGGAREIYFNDQQAELTPTYVTDRTILVSVPSEVPGVITDKMTIIFDDGYELVYDFAIEVPAPELYSITCEYVPDGGTVELVGDYFFYPTTVIFPGELEGEITTLFQDRIEVTVPEGSTPGRIKIHTNFGEVESNFLFRDNRNTIVNFDDLMHETWTAAVAYADSAPDPAVCSGNYAVVQSSAAAAWLWENNLAIFAWGEGARATEEQLVTGFIPDLDFRFEANVPIPWYDIRMEIYFSPYGQGHGRDAVDPSFARWKPWLEEPYTTEGWVTVSIPLSEFWFDRDDGTGLTEGSQPLEDLTGLTNLNMMVFGPQESDAANTYPVQICIDNVRIVPRSVE